MIKLRISHRSLLKNKTYNKNKLKCNNSYNKRRKKCFNGSKRLSIFKNLYNKLMSLKLMYTNIKKYYNLFKKY